MYTVHIQFAQGGLLCSYTSAYDELESEGFIYTLPGKGCFVAERSTELLREENLRKIESHMQEIRRLANACRLTEQELDDMWRLQKEEAE